MVNFSKNLSVFLLSSIFITLLNASTWTEDEIIRINSFSLKQLETVVDVSNKYLSNKYAKELGEQLFSDTRLSSNKKISCATCHIKDQAFTDNKNLAIGLQKGFRNTSTLLNVAHHNWFFADGSKDSLWAQVLSSLENPAEHNFTRLELLTLFHQDNNYKQLYKNTFKKYPPLDSDPVTLPTKAGPNSDLQGLIDWKKLTKKHRDEINLFFTNIGKSIAAYITTIQSNATRFDFFVDYINNNSANSSLLNASELNGYKLFISQKAGCANCHSGPIFTNKEFHNIGTGVLARDNGRSEVIEAVIHDEFNCLSKYSDAKPEQCTELNYINRNKHSLSGSFKTPSLRNISKTSPYMHDGRFSDLQQVLKYYSSIDQEKAKEVDLPPVSLTEKEQLDIINFLLTL